MKSKGRVDVWIVLYVLSEQRTRRRCEEHVELKSGLTSDSGFHILGRVRLCC